VLDEYPDFCTLVEGYVAYSGSGAISLEEYPCGELAPGSTAMLAGLRREPAEHGGMSSVPRGTAPGTLPAGASYGAAKQSMGRKYATPDLLAAATGFGTDCGLPSAVPPRHSRSAETTIAATTSARITRNAPPRR
jgi:hypothetical protein